jgi:tight adherence protein C
MRAATVGLLVGCAVALVLRGVVPARRPARVRELRPRWARRERRAVASAAGWWAGATTSLGATLRRLAGRRDDEVASRRLGAAVLAGGVAAFVHPLAGLIAGSAAWAVPLLRTRHERRRREREVVDGLPDVVDLFRLAAGAGLTVGHAVSAVSECVDGLYRTALAEVVRLMRLGVPLADALEVLRMLGDPVLPLHLALVSSVRDGSRLAEPLRGVAAEARDIRRRAAQERARRLPVQLLFPLVLCILPAFGLLTVVPLLAGTLRSLSF